MSNQVITQAEIDKIMSLNQSQVDEYYRLIKARRGQLNEVKSLQMRPDQKVWFEAGRRGTIHGKILRVNRKTCSVLAKDGICWKVDVGLLHLEK